MKPCQKCKATGFSRSRRSFDGAALLCPLCSGSGFDPRNNYIRIKKTLDTKHHKSIIKGKLNFIDGGKT